MVIFIFHTLTRCYIGDWHNIKDTKLLKKIGPQKGALGTYRPCLFLNPKDTLPPWLISQCHPSAGFDPRHDQADAEDAGEDLAKELLGDYMAGDSWIYKPFFDDLHSIPIFGSGFLDMAHVFPNCNFVDRLKQLRPNLPAEFQRWHQWSLVSQGNDS